MSGRHCSCRLYGPVPRNSGVLSAVQIPHYSSIPEADFQRVLMGTRLPRFDCKLDMTWRFFFSSCQLKKNDRACRRVAVTVGKTEHLDSAYVR